MARRPSKAHRGKRRWIGFRTAQVCDRSELSEQMNEIGAQLYDLKGDLAIVRVKLEQYQDVRDKLSSPLYETITSSGKISLVRARLGLSRPKNKR